ncbi:MAG: hypothetical protein VX589_04685 [Myxococcota bacterium]|nr:hypothetical protein [Myxococcota bacterium]
MGRLKNNGAVLVMLLGLLLGQVGIVHASNEVTAKVAVIHATKTAGGMDAKLSKKIVRSLRKTFGGFKTFKELDKKTIKLVMNKSKQITLPNAQKATLNYRGKKGRSHLLTFAIPESKVNVDLRAPAKKLFYQAGIPHKDGILILAFYLKENG